MRGRHKRFRFHGRLYGVRPQNLQTVVHLVLRCDLDPEDLRTLVVDLGPYEVPEPPPTIEDLAEEMGIVTS